MLPADGKRETIMRQTATAVTLTILLAAAPGHAFDAAGADVLGLRLGMAEPEIAERLTRQGFSVTRLAGPCSDRDTCLVTIKTNTRDGELRIIVSGGTGTQQVQYHFVGRGAGEPEKIKAAMTDRFGRPDQPMPMTWCRTAAADGACPRQQASLTFLPETLTVTLKAGDSGSP
jgi:hypothetical protein